jgi:hypothetical protein
VHGKREGKAEPEAEVEKARAISTHEKRRSETSVLPVVPCLTAIEHAPLGR